MDYVLLIIGGFFAGLYGAICGGSSLVTVPILMAVGLTSQSVLGTNKIPNLLASITTNYVHIKSKKIDYNFMKKISLLMIIMTILGVVFVSILPKEYLKPMIIVSLVVALAYGFKKSVWVEIDKEEKKYDKKVIYMQYILLAMIIFYLAGFGAGGASFLIVLFLYMGYKPVESVVNSSFLNLLVNIVGSAVFIFYGNINFKLGFIMAIGMIIGSYIGAKLLYKVNAKYIRYVFTVVTISLILSQVIK